jgi:hypothetical protein
MDGLELGGDTSSSIGMLSCEFGVTVDLRVVVSKELEFLRKHFY